MRNRSADLYLHRSEPAGGGITEVPEASVHTSIEQGVDHVEAAGRTEDLKVARSGSVAGSAVGAGLEESGWLADRRPAAARTDEMPPCYS